MSLSSRTQDPTTPTRSPAGALRPPTTNEARRSQGVQQKHKRGGDRHGHEHARDRHRRQQRDPGTSEPSPKPRPGDEQTGRYTDLKRRTALRYQRRANAMLPADSHPSGFSTRTHPVPRQLPTSVAPIPERLNSMLQIRRGQQPLKELLISRSPTRLHHNPFSQTAGGALVDRPHTWTSTSTRRARDHGLHWRAGRDRARRYRSPTK